MCFYELFAGYPWYHKDEILYAKGFPWSQSTKERFSLLRDGVLGDIDPDEYVEAACNETIAMTDYLDTDTPKDRRMREMFLLNFHWFMQVLLDRKDRMSMANGLEVRVPFCDYRITEYAYNIPWEIKAYQGREKGIVRYAVQDLLPHDVVWRKKSPYPKTHNPLYFSTVIDTFQKILKNPNNRITEILDPSKLQDIIDTAGASFQKNWYGQLMTEPQLFAYLIQLEYWLQAYQVVLQ